MVSNNTVVEKPVLLSVAGVCVCVCVFSCVQLCSVLLVP